MYEATAEFRWALRLDAVGQSTAWHMVPPGALPAFTNHELDVVPGKLWSDRYMYSDENWGHLGRMLDVSAEDDTFTVASSHAAFFAQYSEEYYLEPWPAEILFEDGEYRTITGYHAEQDNEGNWIVTFTVDPPFSQAIEYPNTTFQVKRGHRADYNPCYFFKNGSNDLEGWMKAFCNYLQAEWGGTGLPDPVAVIIGTEDVGAVSVDWANYRDYFNDTRRSSTQAPDVDGELQWYTIDGERNLDEWHEEFAYVDGDPESPLFTGDPPTYTPQGPDYSPANSDVQSYLGATFITAYNYHRERSTWRHLRSVWPDAKMSQYLIGDGYGTTDPLTGDRRPVPTGPGQEVYHGIPTWYGSVNWDAYACITNPRFPLEAEPYSGGVVPIWHHSAESTTGTAHDTQSDIALIVKGFGPWHHDPNGPPWDPSGYIANDLPIFIEFTSAGPNQGYVAKAIYWDDFTGTFVFETALPAPADEDDTFIVYYPTLPGSQYLLNDTPWPLIETFCERYGEPVTAAGFLATGKKWAMEQARAQTRALPENPYTLTIGPGGYDGNPEVVSRWATYPNAPFTSKDGWLDGDDWGEVGAQAIDYGVNHFEWFVPGIVNSGGDPHPQLVDHLVTAMDAMNARYEANRRAYRAVWCLADWNLDNIISFADQTSFYSDFTNYHPDADLNGDEEFTNADIDIFMSASDCGLDHFMDCNGNDEHDPTEIANSPDVDPTNGRPDLDENENGVLDECEDCAADWDGDLVVAIPDIFAFLSDWFAEDPDARNFGGAPGVPAIFAFLAAWFAHGQGPC